MAINHCFYVIKHLTKLVVGFPTMTWNFMEFKIKEQLPPHVFEVNTFQSCILALWKFDWENKRAGQKYSFLFCSKRKAFCFKYLGCFCCGCWCSSAAPCLQLRAASQNLGNRMCSCRQPKRASLCYTYCMPNSGNMGSAIPSETGNPGISNLQLKIRVSTKHSTWVAADFVFSETVVKFRDTQHTSQVWDSLPACS